MANTHYDKTYNPGRDKGYKKDEEINSSPFS